MLSADPAGAAGTGAPEALELLPLELELPPELPVSVLVPGWWRLWCTA